jgi:hypothetical protein
MIESKDPTRPWKLHRPGPPVVVLATGLVASTALLLWHSRTLWFFGDEWAFIYHRALTGGDGPGPLAPHNEHWSTIPLILYRVMWHVVGLQHYPLWDLMPVLTLMVGSAAMYVLLTGVGVPGWPATVSALVLAWNGSGEDSLWAFQVGFLGSLTAGVLACVAVQKGPSPRFTVLANLVLVAGLMCSGLGIPMVAWASLFALMQRGWRAALTVGVVPTATYGVWYIFYGSDAVQQAGGLPDPSPSAFLTYVWTGVGHVWDVTTGISGVGPLVFLALASVALFVPMTRDVHALAVSGIAAAIFAYTMLAVSRAAFGVEQATALRYVPLGLVLTLPTFAIVASLVGQVLPASRIESLVVAVGLSGLLLLSSYASTRTFAHDRATVVAGLEERVLTGVELIQRGEPLMRSTVEGPLQPPIDVGRLAQPGQRDEVPRVTLDDHELWMARAQFRIGASPAPYNLPFAHAVTGVGVAGDLDLSDCAAVATSTLPTGYVDIPAGTSGVQVGLRNPGTGVSVALVHGGEVTPPATLSTPPGQIVYVGTNVPGANIRITLSTDTFGICDHG